jgi:hypothetical protein
MNVTINLLEKKNIYKIREWRNAQMEFLRQKTTLSVEDQEEWWDRYVTDLASPDSYHPPNLLCAIYRNQEFIGYGGLVHINWDEKEAEVSFLLNPEITNYAEIYHHFINLLKSQVVKKYGLHKLTSETLGDRSFHMGVLELNGWQRVSTKHEMVIND